jgi:hypothetical protein
MKRRIAIWASAGALVVICLRLYISATFSNPLSARGIVSTLIYLICPIALVHRYPVSFYLVLLVNAATYALAGAVVETMRRYYQTTAWFQPNRPAAGDSR